MTVFAEELVFWHMIFLCFRLNPEILVNTNKIQNFYFKDMFPALEIFLSANPLGLV